MVKFVVLFDLSIDRTKESLLLLAFFQYLDKSNVYEILTSGRRRVIKQIGSITSFPSSTVLIRDNPSWSHQMEHRAGNGFICFSEK